MADYLERDPRALAHAGDPDTSHAAAQDIHNVRRTHRARILAAIRAAGPVGLTYPEAADRAGMMERIEAARRITDLVNLGLIEPIPGGERRLPSGRKGRAYRATEPTPPTLF